MPKQKYYVVWNGRSKGVFDNWDECRRSVEGYPDPKYKSFDSYTEAVIAFEKSSRDFIKSKAAEKKIIPTGKTITAGKPVLDAIAVDAACSGNPGRMEYRGVDIQAQEEIFHGGPFEEGTNNIGEFLAIVHALAMLKKQNSNKIIYTDSMTALSWVKNKKAKTKLEPTSRNQKLFDLIERAEQWLHKNSYFTPVIKWQTGKWGEIPADFGRK